MGILALLLVLAGVLLIAAALVGRATDVRNQHLALVDGVAVGDRRKPSFGRFEWVLFGISSVYILWTVLSSPVKGLADQGDYQRLTVQLGVAPVPSQPYSAYALTYKYRIHQSLAAMGLPPGVAGNAKTYSYYFGYHSAQLVMARIALGLHGLFAGGTTFDLRWLGLVNALVWIGALASLFAASRQLPVRARGAAEVLLALAFTDFGYVQYFNSFFSEPTEISFLLLALGLAACTASSRRPLLPFAGFVLASAMAVSAKTEDAVIGIGLAALVVVVAWRHLGPSLRRRLAGATSAAVVLGFAAWDWTAQVPYLQRYQLYDSVFDGILRAAPNPRVALRQLGLSQSLARYAGFATADARSAFSKAIAQTDFFPHIGVLKIVKYYLLHPGSLYTLLSKDASGALLLRPPYANLPAGAGTGTLQYATNSPWTLVHRSLIPHSLFFVALLLVVAAVTAVVCWKRSGSSSTSPEVLLVAAILAGLVFVQDPVGGGLDGIIKHGVLLNMLIDLMLILLVTLGAERLWSRVAASWAVRSGLVPADGEVELGSYYEDLAPADDVDDYVSTVGSRGGVTELPDGDRGRAGAVQQGHVGAEGP